jgi:ligand-binding sensor domain-containing protein/serine phosphatase RsbU (regulator of sigma subunit)
MVQAIDSPYFAGKPEIDVAKEMDSKDQNPQNFSFFGKLQGLKHGSINFITQDKTGSLWFCTGGGGVIRYDGKLFTTYANKEGLVNNNVTCILEDKKGNLWIGTSEGVSKYDGKFFTTFTTKEGLVSNLVYCILEDKIGNIWFATNGGLSKYYNNTFTNFTINEGLVDNIIFKIIEDKNGNLWFTTNAGISKYDGKMFANYTQKEGLPSSTVNSILEDKNGNFWFGTDAGISRYNGKFFTNYSISQGLVDNVVYSIKEDKSGNLWIGTIGGVSKFDGIHFSNYTKKEGLSNNTVINIFQDRSLNLWFGTRGGGVNRYDGKIFNSFTTEEGLVNNTVRCIAEDKNGMLWLATDGGVNRYSENLFSTFTQKEGLSTSVIYSLLEDKHRNFWFGTFGGGVIKYDGKSFTTFTEREGLVNNVVWRIVEDKRGNLWFSTDGGISKYDGTSFTNFTQKEGLTKNNIKCSLEDKKGNLWFGTIKGVNKFDGKTFTIYNEKGGLVNNSVRCSLEDKNGNLWFGTEGGVSRYDGKIFINFTEKVGLVNNTVLSILEDKNGNIWFGTRFGLSKLTLAKNLEVVKKVKTKTLTEQDVIFKNYSYTDGFLGVGVFAGKTMCQAKDGIIWIAANDRLTAYHPEGDVTNVVPPNIQLTSIEIFNESINWLTLLAPTSPKSLTKEHSTIIKDTSITLGNGVTFSDFYFDGITKWYGLPENLSLAYYNNYLTFNFIGITMSQPKKVNYLYKLEGIDKNWSAMTNKTSATYGNLPSGTFTFKVKAMNNEGSWCKPIEYSFTIRPPYWQLWWFRNLIVVVTIILAYSLYRWRTAALRHDKERLEKVVQERTAEVQEQKQLIEVKHKEITDSINYAERIQRSLLASKKILDDNLSDYFIVFKPKAVVSGDFYWAAKLSNNNFALVTADSTGHGVPGAIMSIVNIASLKEALLQEITSPDLFLNETRRLVIENLKNDGSPEGGKDGMDGSFLSFDFKTNILQCASANSPIWIVRTSSSSEVGDKPELIEIKADRFPIGKHDRDNTSFTLHTINLQKGDVVYTLTDGFPDQFGGLKGKKFKHKHLKEFLLEIAHEPMQTQKQKLNDAFINWKADLEQVDGVTIIGIRI